MNFKEIAANYSKEKRKMMTEAVITNANHQKNYPSHHSTSLNLMFAEWHLLFPANKQDIQCTSCRAAICKFWSVMVDAWIETEQTPKKKNVHKKNKTK